MFCGRGSIRPLGGVNQKSLRSGVIAPISTQKPQASLAARLGTVLLIAPSHSLAAGGRTYEEVLIAFLALSPIGLLAWAIYYFTPLHRHFVRRRVQYWKVILPLLGLIALAIGVTSIVTGESSLCQGSAALRAIEPQRFWQQVALKIGAGCFLIVIGLLHWLRGE